MTQADKFLEVATKEIGTVETGENHTKYGKFTKHDGQPWCGSFVMWCANEVKVKIPNVVYTPAGVTGFQGIGRWVNAATAKPKPGDIVFFDFVEGGNPNLSKIRRETLFIQLLESIHPKDAILLSSIKDKKIPFKGLTKKIVHQAFPDINIEASKEEV
jgi:hypothetical protein